MTAQVDLAKLHHMLALQMQRVAESGEARGVDRLDVASAFLATGLRGLIATLGGAAAQTYLRELADNIAISEPKLN